MKASEKTAARLKHGNMWVINDKMLDPDGDASIIQIPVAAYPAYEVQGYRKYNPMPAEPVAPPAAVKPVAPAVVAPMPAEPVAPPAEEVEASEPVKEETALETQPVQTQINSPKSKSDGKAVDSNKQGDGTPVSRYPGGKK